jgi:bifunctional non-homologous end joining protein LigD
MDLPYAQRRELLDALAVAGANWQTPPHFAGGGRYALETARAQGLKGVVAKRLESPYRPGERSTDWLAVGSAAADARAEVVVVGWRPGTGRRAGTLLVAEPDGDGRLRYAGAVGAGLTRAALDDLLPRLRRLARRTPPVDGVPPAQARDANWVSPKLTGEVAYAGRAADGRLRQPRWLGPR